MVHLRIRYTMHDMAIAPSALQRLLGPLSDPRRRTTPESRQGVCQVCQAPLPCRCIHSVPESPLLRNLCLRQDWRRSSVVVVQPRPSACSCCLGLALALAVSRKATSRNHHLTSFHVVLVWKRRGLRVAGSLIPASTTDSWCACLGARLVVPTTSLVVNLCLLPV
ncbi:hypothetical protein LZ30DRAFT_298412 [Colletotrichum cereale]|nr:hypothetical protein LZ30DRAFT_298412 [Colletotrichum cereale]